MQSVCAHRNSGLDFGLAWAESLALQEVLFSVHKVAPSGLQLSLCQAFEPEWNTFERIFDWLLDWQHVHIQGVHVPCLVWSAATLEVLQLQQMHGFWSLNHLPLFCLHRDLKLHTGLRSTFCHCSRTARLWYRKLLSRLAVNPTLCNAVPSCS